MWRCRAADASRVQAAPSGSVPARWYGCSRRSSNQLVARHGHTALGHPRWRWSMVPVAAQVAAIAATAGRFAAYETFAFPRHNPCAAAAAATVRVQTESRVVPRAGHLVVRAATNTAAGPYLLADRQAARQVQEPGVSVRRRRGRSRLTGYVDFE